MKSNKGYSLIEIAVGLAIITIFLICTNSLINASFTNYRMVVKRNEAMSLAISEMEKVLQADSVSCGEYTTTLDSFEAKVKIDNARDGAKVYDDTVYTVVVNVEYSKSEKDAQKYNIELKSLKILK